VTRLTRLADLRRGKLPDDLVAYASSLSGFQESAIDAACTSFERARRQEGETAFPELGAMLEACRLHSRPDPRTTWTIQKYRECRDFDLWVNEQMEQRRCSREMVITAYVDTPDAAKRAVHEGIVWAWVAWRNQREKGTLHCSGWCDRCSGDRLVFAEFRGRPAAGPCPDCRGPRAA
jgi:hypothetical protein